MYLIHLIILFFFLNLGLQSGHVIVNSFDTSQKEIPESEPEFSFKSKQFPVFRDFFVSLFDGPISDVVLFNKHSSFPLYTPQQYQYKLFRKKSYSNEIISRYEEELFKEDDSAKINLLLCGSLGYGAVSFDVLTNGLIKSEMLPRSFEFDSVKKKFFSLHLFPSSFSLLF